VSRVSSSELFTVASRAAVPPFHVMDLLAAAARRQRSHGDLLNLVAGQPSTPAPVAVREAAKRALDEQVLGYTVAVGIPELREAIAARLTARGLPSRADEVLVTAGAQHALHLLLTLLAGPGERVLVDAPAYPRTLSAIRTARARAIAVPLTPAGWDVDAWEGTLAASSPPLAVTVADFHNPTGLVMTAEDRTALARACARAGTLLVVDETFAELRLDGPALPPPVGAFDPGAAVVTVGTLSKSAWGGLRVGWIRASRRLVSELASVRASLDMAGPVLDQLLALELLGEWDAVLADRRALLKPRRSALLDALPPDWTYRRPRGGMSAWVQLPAPVATRLAGLAGTRGLGVTPGPAFSVDGTFESHLRLPFTLPPDDLREAGARLRDLAADLTEGVGGVEPRVALAV
jgi:DNA-binding transcriptional MocR family regulator